ncbi:MAG: hypothetical protein IIU28_06485 [Lachnospiraceae bacterium]|nr:hypothetical protein [Lachnospiraceae bacterium]
MKRGTQILLLILFSIIILGGSTFIIFEVLGGGFFYRSDTVTEQKGGGYSGQTSNSTVNSYNGQKSDQSTTVSPLSEDTGIIYIGDSRFVGMNDVCHIDSNSNRFVVAKVGQGLSWLKREGLPQAQQIVSSNPSLHHFKYVICLGVNDLADIEGYKEVYRQLSQDHDLTLVSVGPVGNYPGLSNVDIESFNQQLKDLCSECSIPYIDDYTVLTTEGYQTQDGLHYKDAVYQRIYQILQQQVEGITSWENTGENN